MDRAGHHPWEAGFKQAYLSCSRARRGLLGDQSSVGGPATFCIWPTALADECAATFGDGLEESKAALADYHITQTLIRCAIFIGCGGGGGKPALIDATSVHAERVEVIRMQLETPSGLEENARDPTGGQPEQTSRGGNFGFNKPRNVLVARY
jgi:hypothetical protein